MSRKSHRVGPCLPSTYDGRFQKWGPTTLLENYEAVMEDLAVKCRYGEGDPIEAALDCLEERYTELRLASGLPPETAKASMGETSRDAGTKDGANEI